MASVVGDSVQSLLYMNIYLHIIDWHLIYTTFQRLSIRVIRVNGGILLRSFPHRFSRMDRQRQMVYFTVLSAARL